MTGGSSFSLLSEVYKGSAAYSGLRALNDTHVGVMINVGSAHAGSMACGAMTKYVVLCDWRDPVLDVVGSFLSEASS